MSHPQQPDLTQTASVRNRRTAWLSYKFCARHIVARTREKDGTPVLITSCPVGNCRPFFGSTFPPGSMVCAVLLSYLFSGITAIAQDGIDRRALVTRRNPVICKLDPDAPLTVGNGSFAFTTDITGLQTFAEHYHRWGIPVETQSRWCWVSDPNPNNYKLSDANQDFKQADGRVVGYPTQASSPAGDWLRKNPRIHPLGQISLDFVKG